MQENFVVLRRKIWTLKGQDKLPPVQQEEPEFYDKGFVIESHVVQLKDDTEPDDKKSKPLPSIFYKPVDHYLDYENPVTDIGDMSTVHVPLNIDTEFQSFPLHWSESLETIEGVQKLREQRQTGRQHLTTQIRGIHQTEGKIYTAREVSEIIPRHKVLTAGFDPVDYLNDLGCDVTIKRYDPTKTSKKFKANFRKQYPEMRFVLFAHFATAELMLIVRDGFWTDFEHLTAEKEPKNDSAGNPRFTLKRHLKAITEKKNPKNGNKIVHNFIELPWVVRVNNFEYRVTVEWVDTCALHGIASYKNICKSSNVKLIYKDNFTSEEKRRMLEMAVKRPVDFDNYSLGDLSCFDALVGNAENFKTVYQALGIEQSFKPPALTIGATVKNIFEAKLCDVLNIEYGKKSNDLPEEFTLNYLRENFLSPVSAKTLRQNPGLTRCLTAKVEGGRCRNNRPTVTTLETPLCDIDVSGCYAEGLRSQPYPIGNPEILDFEATNKSDYWTLEQFLKNYKGELVRGLWVARVWTDETLECPQDFLASWFVPSVGDDLLALGKYIIKEANDTENQNVDESPEFDLEDGNLKIFNTEVVNGVITQDFIDWLDNVASRNQKSKLKKKLKIKAAIVYPKSWEIKGENPVEKYRFLIEQSNSHADSDKVERVKRKGRKKLRKEDGQFHGWFSVNLGDLIMDELLTWRKFYKVRDGKKSPMDIVMKLCCNTLYGDMTSKYFDSANVVVGNNVTARARSMVWYAEKALNGVQTITDGGAFELNSVCYPRTKKDRLTGENTVNLYFLDGDGMRKKHLIFKPLGNCDSISIEWVDSEKGKLPILVLEKDETITRLEGSKAEQWINETAMEHLRKQFPKIPILHCESKGINVSIEDNKPVRTYTKRIGLFSFEMKAFFDSGAFHGSGNYLLVNPNGETLKMRSYETTKPHDSIDSALSERLDDREMVYTPYLTERYGVSNNPAKDFMHGILTGAYLNRQVPFVKEGILKPSDYKEHHSKYRNFGLVPGDGLYKCGLLREFSLSQFTFPNMKTFILWDKKIGRLKDKYGQSMERYFTDDEGTLDFNTMTLEIDQLVREGYTDPIKRLDSNYQKSRVGSSEHPQYKTLVSIKDLLSNIGEPE